MSYWRVSLNRCRWRLSRLSCGLRFSVADSVRLVGRTIYEPLGLFVFFALNHFSFDYLIGQDCRNVLNLNLNIRRDAPKLTA